MTRKEWLTKEHRNIDSQIQQLEKERESNRSYEHKALLVSLKKRKLEVKTELCSLVA